MSLGLDKVEEACTQMGVRNPNCLCGLRKSFGYILLGGWSYLFIDPRSRFTIYGPRVPILYNFWVASLSRLTHSLLLMI
jgi:hypothetical protein